MKSIIEEFRSNGKCRALCNRSFCYAGQRTFALRDSAKAYVLPCSRQLHACLIFAFGLLVQSLSAGEIVQKRLDELVIYNLPIAFKSGNTTILFPSAISGLYAKSVAAQEQPNADFLISFTPDNYYFTVGALKRDAEDHLTVIYNRKAYCFV
jgi:hypothetical protein